MDRLSLANDALAKGHITQDEFSKIALDEKAITPEEYARVTAPGWKKAVSKYGGPALEFGGLMGGEALGAIGGSFLDPFIGPAGTIGGKVVGGSAGEAGGEVGRKGLDTMLGLRKRPSGQEIFETLKGGAKRGAIYSGIGQGINLGAGTELGQKILEPVGKGFSKIFEAASNTPGRVFDWVRKDPGTILPPWLGGPPAKKMAGEALGKAEEAAVASLPGGAAMEGAGIGPSKMRAARKAHIDDVFNAVNEGSKITENEALKTYHELNKELKILERSESEVAKDTVRDYQWLKGEMKKSFGEKFPGVSGALKDYARAATREEATNVLPKGFGLRYLARRSVPLVAGYMNPTLLPLILGSMSPLTAGLGTAAVSSGAMTSPAVKGVSAILRKLRENSDSQQ